jgi:hypothetical protein
MHQDSIQESQEFALIERPNTQLGLLSLTAEELVAEHHRLRLLLLRPRVLARLVSEVAYCYKGLTEVRSSIHPFLYDIKNYYLDKMDLTNPEVDQWDNLIHYLKLNNSRLLTRDNRSRKLRALIQFEFDIIFKERTPLPDALNKAVAEIQAAEKITLSHYENVCALLKTDPECDVEKLTAEQVQQFEPAIILLKNTGLLNKINFLRIFLCINPATTDFRGIYSEYHSTYDAKLYLQSPVSPEDTMGFISRLAELNILTQKNLEILFKIIELNAARRNVNSIKMLLTSFSYSAENNDVDNHKDTFEKFINEWHRDSTALSADEKDLSAEADMDHTQVILANRIETYISNFVAQVSGQQELLTEEKHNELVLYCNTTVARPEDLQSVVDNTTELAKMTALLLQDNIHTNLNIALLFQHASKAGFITEAYRLLKENNTYDTPQETFDALIENAEYAEHITPMLLWLPRKSRSRDRYQLILFHAPYAADLLAVASAEFNVTSHPSNNLSLSAEEYLSRQKVVEKIFENCIRRKLQYLKPLRCIYEFILKHGLMLAQISSGLELRLQYVPALAGIIANESTEDMDFLQANRFYSKADSTAQDNSMEENNKWLRKLHKNNICQRLYINTTVDPTRITCNSAYIFTHRELHYINKFQGVFQKIPVDPVNFHSLHKFQKDCLNDSELAQITSLTGHIHTTIPEEIFTRLKYNLAGDRTQLLQSYLLLHKASLLTPEWEELLHDNPSCSITIAKALIMLERNALLEPKYTDLLIRRPELALAIAIVLAGYNNTNSLTDENFEILKNNLRSAAKLARQFAPEHDEQVARSIGSVESLLLTEDAGDDSTALVLTSYQKPVRQISTTVTINEEKPSEPQQTSTPSSHTVAMNTINTSFNQSLAQRSEIDDLVTELIASCKLDYENRKPFARSTFLKNLPSHGMPHYSTIQNYVLNNQRSRTARFWVTLKVDRMPEGDFKSFWKKYLSDYHFSFYQRSHLIEKFLTGEIKSIQDVIMHAASGSNRTRRVLNS